MGGGMRIRPFDYWAAPTLSEALTELATSGRGTMIVAGGTDLVVKLKKKQVQPRRLISLHKLVELDFIASGDDVIRIGALCRHADVASSPLLKEMLPIISDAASLIGSWQARNAGTIGGNICNASPAADSAPPLLALNADVVIASAAGERVVGIETFFTGPGTSILEPIEIVKEFVVKLPVGPSAGCFLKLRRRGAVDLSLASVAFQAELDKDERTLSRVGIALGAVGPRPVRARDAESALTGLTIYQARASIGQIADLSVGASAPIDDVRASAGYRRSIIDTFVRQCADEVFATLEEAGGA
jgi:CO/xanthine dehydrogenase FAD-binding subunit